MRLTLPPPQPSEMLLVYRNYESYLKQGSISGLSSLAAKELEHAKNLLSVFKAYAIYTCETPEEVAPLVEKCIVVTPPSLMETKDAVALIQFLKTTEHFKKPETLKNLIFDCCISGNSVLLEKAIELYNLSTSTPQSHLLLKKDRGMTPLHIACEHGHAAIASLLIAKGAPIDEPNELNETPLHLACENGAITLAKELVEKGASLQTKNADGDTPFHFLAVWHLLPETLNFFLNQNFPIHTKNNDRQTLLHIASEYNQIDLALALIHLNGKINEKDSAGKTPLHYACEYGHIELALKLIEKGASVKEKDNNGNSALHFVCKDTYQLHGKNPTTMIDALLSHGADINAKNKFNQTPLHLACLLGHTGLALHLIQKKPDVHAKDHRGRTALHMICYNPESEANPDETLKLLDALLEQNADINSKDSFAETPLHYACKNDLLILIPALIKRGASYAEPNMAHDLPLELMDYELDNYIVTMLSPIDQSLIQAVNLIRDRKEIELKDVIQTWTSMPEFDALIMKAFSIPFLIPSLLRSNADALGDFRIYHLVKELPLAKKAIYLFLFSATEQREILQSLSANDKAALLQQEIFDLNFQKSTLSAVMQSMRGRKRIPLKILKQIPPLSLAILLETEQYKNQLIESFSEMSPEQIRILAPRLSSHGWQRLLLRADPAVQKEMILFASPNLDEENFICSDYFAIEDQLDELMSSLDQATESEQTYQKLSQQFLFCSLQKAKTNQLRLVSQIKRLMEHPFLQHRKAEFQALIEAGTKRIGNIEKKHKVITRKLDDLGMKYEVNIPPEYLDPTTRELLIPEECVSDPYTGHKQMCNSSSIQKNGNRSLFTGQKFSSSNPPLPVSHDFAQALKTLHEAQAQGNDALRKALAALSQNKAN